VTPPWWTARVRLTLLYTGLFVVCGAIVIAITYGLVASLQTPSANPGATCPQPDQAARNRCKGAFVEAAARGAQMQREATLAHLLRYSLIALAAAALLAAAAGWIAAGRVLRPVLQVHPIQRGHRPKALAQPFGHNRRIRHRLPPHAVRQPPDG